MIHAAERIQRTYLLVILVFATGYGIYGGFQSTFLVQRIRAAGGGSSVPIFGDVLVVILAAMLFEFVLSPLGGYFADRHGRVQAFVLATLLMAACCVLYAAAGTSFVLPYGVNGVLILAVVAEALLAAGYALRAGSLEAWVTDALDSIGYGELRPRIYARQWQAVSIGITAGGSFGLSYAGYRGEIGGHLLRSFGVLTWMTAAALLLFAGTVAFAAMEEARPGAEAHRSATGPRPGLLRSIQTVLAAPRARNVLGLSALLYTSFLLFLYLNPVMSRNAPNTAVSVWLQTWYGLVFVGLGVLRVLGPAATQYLRTRYEPALLMRRLGVGHGVAMAVGGGFGLLTPATEGDVYIVCAILCLYVAKFLEEALKPIRSEAVNAVVTDPKDRALVVSLVTPGGAFVVFVLCAAAQVMRHSWGAAVERQPALGSLDLWTLCSLAFASGGVLIVVATMLLERRLSAPVSPLAVGGVHAK